MNEHEMADLLKRAGSRLDPDVPRLIAGGAAKGRSARRRHAIGVLAVAAVVVGASVTSVSLVAGRGGDTGAAAAADLGSSATTDPTPAPPTVTPDVHRRPPIVASDLPSAFASVLPGDVEVLSYVDRPGKQAGSGPLADFRWKGFAARAYVAIAVLPNATPWERCQLASGGDGTAATCVRRPDGSVVERMQWTGPEVDGGVTGRSVVAFTNDGWQVGVQVFNAADSKESPILADQPPASLDDLVRAVTSGVWFR